MSSTQEEVLRLAKAARESVEDKLPQLEGVFRIFCSGLRRLRMFVPASPGTGHQGTSVMIMRRMIFNGFTNGLLEIYYDPANDNLQKLLNFIPEAIADPANWRIGDVRGALIPFQPSPTPVEEWEFGITGGTDSYTQDLANVMNCKAFLQLQPFSWAIKIARTRKPNRVWIKGVKDGFVPLSEIDFYPYSEPTGVPQNWEELAVIYPAKVDTLRAVQQVLDNRSVNVFPVYGISGLVMGDTPTDTLDTLPSGTQSSLLFNLFSALLAVQRTEVPAARKPALVLLISNLSGPGDRNLTNLLDANTAYDALNHYIRTYMMVGGVESRVTLLRVEDAGTPAAILDLQGREDCILVVKVGRIPSSFFNYYYENASLPGVLEGAGTYNYVVNAGCRYVRLREDPSNAADILPPLSLKPGAIPLATLYVQPSVALVTTTPQIWDRKLLAAASALEIGQLPAGEAQLKRIVSSPAAPRETLPDIEYGDMILASLDDASEYSQYIRTLPSVFHDRVWDKLMNAITLAVLAGVQPSDTFSQLLVSRRHPLQATL